MEHLIQRFYSAFNDHNGETMAACYAPDARFSDPVFPDLRGAEAGAMWKMLTARADDLRVELAEHEASGDSGSAHWVAYYTFRTGRQVVNDIHAKFLFRDGLIAEHKDKFSFWNWSRQALGPAGMALGWTPLLRGKVRKQARADLDAYIASCAKPTPRPPSPAARP
jgi:ketosteroid isomerase-like protein